MLSYPQFVRSGREDLFALFVFLFSYRPSGQGPQLADAAAPLSSIGEESAGFRPSFGFIPSPPGSSISGLVKFISKVLLLPFYIRGLEHFYLFPFGGSR